MNSRQIMQRLKEHYDEVTALGHEIMCLILQGSQNYKLDIYEEGYFSDVDSRAIILPSFDDFCNNKQPISTTYVRHNLEHIDIKDIRPFFEMFKKQNINALETLFSPYFIVNEKYAAFWTRLKRIREQLTHCHPSLTLTTMAGMCFEKRKILCNLSPYNRERVEKYGYDGKQLYTIIRVSEFLHNYLDGMSFRKCLVTHSQKNYKLMIDAKLNRISLNEAIRIADELCSEAIAIKDDYIQKHGSECDKRPYVLLEKIRDSALCYRLKKELEIL